MSRPIIKVSLTNTDKIVELLTVFGLIALFAIPFYYYGDLPDRIPTHFNAAGEPDAFGSKNSIWTLPVIGLLLAVGMAYLNRFPHVFNYPVEITEQNAVHEYQKATQMIRIINFIIVAAFAYINYSTVQTALGSAKGLGAGFIIVLLVAIFGTIAYYLIRSSKKAK